MALPDPMKSPNNSMQRLRNILTEEELECETSRNAQPNDLEVAQYELKLARAVHNTEKIEHLARIVALQNILAKKNVALVTTRADHEDERIMLLSKINSL